MKAKLITLVVAAVVVSLDRLSKEWVNAHLLLGSRYQLLPSLTLTNIQNSGAAFGLAQSYSILLLIIAVIIAAGIIVYVFCTQINWQMGILLGLVLGGALGNVYDRAFGGKVTDFIDLGWWPVFNLADMAISIGIVLLIVGYLRRGQCKENSG